MLRAEICREVAGNHFVARHGKMQTPTVWHLAYGGQDTKLRNAAEFIAALVAGTTMQNAQCW